MAYTLDDNNRLFGNPPISAGDVEDYAAVNRRRIYQNLYNDSRAGWAHVGAPCQGLNPNPNTTEWRWGPRLNPYRAANALPAAHWSHVLSWGHAWHRDGVTTQCTLECKAFQTWAIGSAGVWEKLDESLPFGFDYAGDFSNTKAAETISSTDDVLGVRWDIGRAFHWWSRNGRKQIPAGVRGLFVTGQARAEFDDALAMGFAADWYVDATSVPPPAGNPAINQDVGIGMIRPVTTSWRVFTWSSATKEDMALLPTSIRLK